MRVFDDEMTSVSLILKSDRNDLISKFRIFQS